VVSAGAKGESAVSTGTPAYQWSATRTPDAHAIQPTKHNDSRLQITRLQNTDAPDLAPVLGSDQHKTVAQPRRST